MSIIPQRPPDTPLLQYYSTGKYPKPIEYKNIKPSAAEPGDAARMHERNRPPHEELNVKAITQTKFSSRFYRPDKYLKPESGNMNIHQDVSNNNLHLNKVKNRVKDVEANRAIQQSNYDKPVAEYHIANKVEKNNFEQLRNKQPDSQRSTGGIRPSRGKEIAEVMLRQIGDENEYYKNKKHTFMSGTNGQFYQKTTPDYFRIMDRPQNQVDPTNSKAFDGTMTIVSRNQGWITVTPKNKNRKKPVEKFGVSGDAAKTSKLTPNWMQSQYPKNSSDPMKPVIPKTTNLRAEAKRTYLVERNQKLENPMDVHNIQALSSNITNLMGWKEDSSKQRFDKPVTGKIGSYHG